VEKETEFNVKIRNAVLIAFFLFFFFNTEFTYSLCFLFAVKLLQNFPSAVAGLQN